MIYLKITEWDGFVTTPMPLLYSVTDDKVQLGHDFLLLSLLWLGGRSFLQLKVKDMVLRADSP